MSGFIGFIISIAFGIVIIYHIKRDTGSVWLAAFCGISLIASILNSALISYLIRSDQKIVQFLNRGRK